MGESVYFSENNNTMKSFFIFLLAISSVCATTSCSLFQTSDGGTIDPDSVLLRRPIESFTIKDLYGDWYSSYNQSVIDLHFGNDNTFTTAVNGAAETTGTFRINENDTLVFAGVTNVITGEIILQVKSHLRALSDSVLVMLAKGDQNNQILFRGKSADAIAQDYCSGDIQPDEPSFKMIHVTQPCKVHVVIASNQCCTSFAILHTNDEMVGDNEHDWVGTLQPGDYKLKVTSTTSTHYDLAVSQTRN